MKISIIGAGYVGLVTGIGFAELGHKVIFLDMDEQKVELINSGISLIYEKGLKELMEKNLGRYYATTDYDDAITNTELTFICVGTPSKDDGSIDLKFVKSASKEIGKVLANKGKAFHTVVVKSTICALLYTITVTILTFALSIIIFPYYLLMLTPKKYLKTLQEYFDKNLLNLELTITHLGKEKRYRIKEYDFKWLEKSIESHSIHI